MKTMLRIEVGGIHSVDGFCKL